MDQLSATVITAEEKKEQLIQDIRANEARLSEIKEMKKQILREKQQLYAEYRETKERAKAFENVKRNAKMILGANEKEKTRWYGISSQNILQTANDPLYCN